MTESPAAANRKPQTEARWARIGVNLRGTTALVTGASDGLGREVARQLGALGAFVIVHGRDAQRGESVARAIRAAGPGDAAFHAADFASLSDVRAFADRVRAGHPRLNLLINNAAVVSPPTRKLSADGYELAFAVNYLAPLLLTYRLLPLLQAGSPARIVNVASMGQAPLDFDDLMLERHYEAFDAYRRSKLAQIMFTFDLAAELDPLVITANCLHPARAMNTTRVISGGFAPLSTVEEGAEATMQLAVAPELRGVSGRYYSGLEPATANAQAYDAAARQRLRALSFGMAGLAQ